MRIVVTVKQIIVKSATINIETELMDTGNIGNIKKDILQKYNNGELDEQLEVDDLTTESVIVELESEPHKLQST